jgi:ketol-acid reductoisomerase
VEVFHDDDADLSVIQALRVGVIGFGDQGQAQALCLRDSGVEVCVGLREGSPRRIAAQEEGLVVLTPAGCAEQADVVVLLIPDDAHRALYPSLAPFLRQGRTLVVGHGLTVRFGLIAPPAEVDVVMVSAVGGGELLRRQFLDGKGVPVLVAVAQDATGGAWPLALSYAKAIGGTRAGAIATTVAEQCEADLFGLVLSGALSALGRTAFDILTEAGYSPEIALLAVRRGPGRGDIAEFGAQARTARLIDARMRDQMYAILAEIRGGAIAREWLADEGAGRPRLGAWRTSAHPIEATGRAIRSMMSGVDHTPPTAEEDRD